MLSMFYCEYNTGSCDSKAFLVFILFKYKNKNFPTFLEFGLYFLVKQKDAYFVNNIHKGVLTLNQIFWPKYQ